MRRSGEEGRGLYPTDKYSLYSVDTEERVSLRERGHAHMHLLKQYLVVTLIQQGPYSLADQTLALSGEGLVRYSATDCSG